MKRVLALALLAGCSGLPPPPTPPVTEFMAGAAVVDLTPSRPVPLGGYMDRGGKPMAGVHDPIYAKALWLETPDTRLCIVTTDLIGSAIDIRDRIKPQDASLILTASHTHSGPGALTRGFWQLAMGKFDAEFYDETVRRLQKVVADARAARRPGRLAFVRGSEPSLTRNRCLKDGPVDPEVAVLLVVDNLRRPIASVTNFAAHATVLSSKNFLLSADWPGAFQRALEARLGGLALFINGAEGNISPRSPGGREDFERCAAIGESLARNVGDLVRAVDIFTERVTIRYVERGVDLPTPTLPVAPSRSVLGLLEINGTRMFCFPGEPGVELGLELKRRFPGSWILGLANDHLGYFVTQEEYERSDCYERKVSFYGPRMGAWLVEQFSRLGEGDHAQDRAAQPEGGRGKDDERR